MHSDSDIAALVDALGSKKGAERHDARRRLVAMGDAAVPQLTAALHDPKHNARWGAAKSLGEIADPSSAPALVTALEDEDSDVRWLAALALIGLGNDGLTALLVAIRDNKLELWSHHAAHHVLHDLAKAGRGEELGPLLAAIEGDSAEVHAPVAAEELLRRMQS